jgi:hypothetical protein
MRADYAGAARPLIRPAELKNPIDAWDYLRSKGMGALGEGGVGSPNPVTPRASVCVMHWLEEMLPLARSQSAMVM